MSPNVHILRSLVEQKLTAAGEEIFLLFEKTIAKYEEELCRTKEENQRLRQILDSVLNPRVLIHKTDIQQLSLVKEVSPEQQELNPIVDQEEPKPEPPFIKEEQEELWTSQETNITKFPSTPVPVKNEDDNENVKSSQLNQTPTEESKVEANKVDCALSESASSFHPHRYLQAKTDEQNEDSEETEDSDEDQILNHKPESKLPTNSSTEQMEVETDGDNDGGSEPDIKLVHMESIKGRTIEEHMDTHTGQKLVGSSECEATFSQKKNMTNTDLTPSDVVCEKLYHCSVCSKTFSLKSNLKVHMRIHTVEKPFSCSECSQRFTQKNSLVHHMRLHSSERPFSCSECGHRFTQKKNLVHHIRLHSTERPFSCSECSRTFIWKANLKSHMRIHSGERPFSCSECGQRFTQKKSLVHHTRLHSSERPFSCSECSLRFTQKMDLVRHMRLHSSERPFSCSECSRTFIWKANLKSHMSIHTGERPFSCVVCQKRFRRQDHVQIHMKIHTRK